MDEDTDKQKDNRPWLFKKGQSGNPAGRPKTKTLKEYAREMLASMTDEERAEYFAGMDKKTIWEMAEGKAPQSIDHTTAGKELPVPIINVLQPHNSNEESDGDEPSDTSNSGWDISK